jgi:hypothetical protein
MCLFSIKSYFVEENKPCNGRVASPHSVRRNLAGRLVISYLVSYILLVIWLSSYGLGDFVVLCFEAGPLKGFTAIDIFKSK